ncbi:28S ribosomal protein S30, mitochondrial [Pararge aegeria]|uniref:Jg7691 protein n=1 Tax=Pararge aegeria aegeria TaxID=348720 RepID=A0A8S4RXS1_9NEOP|nr:28S ribosomal protein S30, mitochondrial [Pararge aegeria]CAH2242412.1 jg7691 [Pararge aegeria aegeria]
MQLLRVHRTFPKLKKVITRRYSQALQLEENEYTDAPVYPPIIDTSLEARKLRIRQTLHKKIQEINTVEEKQIALNMPRFYGWQSIVLNDNKVPFNAMPLVQHYTRTHFQSIDKLPEIYAKSSPIADTIVQEIKSCIEECIATENEGVERNIVTSLDKPEKQQISDAHTKNIVKQINRIILNNLTDKVSHILSSQVDYDPRHEAFWFIGSVDLPWDVRKWRKKQKWYKGRLDQPLDRPVQYIGSPILTIRNHLPLKPIIDHSEAENPDFKVPKFSHIPESVGYFSEFRHGTNIPGFWPGDFDEFGLMSFHGRGHILDRSESFGPEDNLEALHCQAIKASFGWLLAQASYQGFTTFNDLTYPLVTQTVLTDGHLVSFYAYQLNTIVMHNDEVDSNPKHNVCFGTKPLELYETIENGKVKGLNEDVLKMLVQFYLNAPEERDHAMKPYLGKEEQIIADIEDDNRRCWLESRYKHLVANRPKHFLLPELYDWEKIYKIKFNTRFFEARRRPFEFDINPFKRRLDDHLPPYIPKVLRPYPKSRKKFETTYYPNV